jgi:two-component system, cell cycle response regulator DivK
MGLRRIIALTAPPMRGEDAEGRDTARRTNPEQSQKAESNMTNSTARKKILIVEDDSDVREILSRVLRTAGYEVQEAGHALGAICAVVRAGADLVLTDINMPIMDGFGLVRELKAHEDTRRVPVVAITGLDTPERRTAALQAGCVGYIAKPIDARELLGRIAEFIRAAQ